LEPLVGQPSHDKAARRLVVKILTDRGELFHMNGRLALARKDMQDALRLMEDGERYLEPAEFRTLQASALLNRSEILTKLGRASEAIEDAKRAVGLLEMTKGAESSAPPNIEDSLLLAMALTNRAVASAALNHHLDAEQAFQQALERARAVPKGSEFYGSAQIQVASTLNQYGELLGRKGENLNKAELCFAESAGILDPIVKKLPRYLFVREELVVSLRGRCEILIRLDRWERANHACETARKLLAELLNASPNNADYLSLSAQTFDVAGRIQLHAGEESRARQSFEKATVLFARALEIDSERQLDRELLGQVQSKLVATRQETSSKP
jgi:tetratricopeptide (TPR) repeat protein